MGDTGCDTTHFKVSLRAAHRPKRQSYRAIAIDSLVSDHLQTWGQRIREAFALLVDRYQKRVYAFAFSQMGNRPDADDLVQETFLRAFEKLDTLRELSKFGVWLIGISRNCVRETLRENFRYVPLGPDVDEIPDNAPHQASDDDTAGMLEAQIRRLVPLHREVLLLHYFSGEKTRDIASILNISHAAVRKRLQRGREALGDQLLEQLHGSFQSEERGRERRIKIMVLIGGANVAWSVAKGGAVAAAASSAVSTKLFFSLGTWSAGKVGLAAATLLTLGTVLVMAPKDSSLPSVPSGSD